MNEQQLIETVDALVAAGKIQEASALVLANAKTILEGQKIALESSIAELTAPREASSTSCVLDLAADTTDAYQRKAYLLGVRATLDSVEAALYRLEKGTFGICSNSDPKKPHNIRPDRLARSLTAKDCNNNCC